MNQELLEKCVCIVSNAIEDGPLALYTVFYYTMKENQILQKELSSKANPLQTTTDKDSYLENINYEKLSSREMMDENLNKVEVVPTLVSEAIFDKHIAEKQKNSIHKDQISKLSLARSYIEGNQDLSPSLNLFSPHPFVGCLCDICQIMLSLKPNHLPYCNVNIKIRNSEQEVPLWEYPEQDCLYKWNVWCKILYIGHKRRLTSNVSSRSKPNLKAKLIGAVIQPYNISENQSKEFFVSLRDVFVFPSHSIGKDHKFLQSSSHRSNEKSVCSKDLPKGTKSDPSGYSSVRLVPPVEMKYKEGDPEFRNQTTEDNCILGNNGSTKRVNLGDSLVYENEMQPPFHPQRRRSHCCNTTNVKQFEDSRTHLFSHEHNSSGHHLNNNCPSHNLRNELRSQLQDFSYPNIVNPYPSNRHDYEAYPRSNVFPNHIQFHCDSNDYLKRPATAFHRKRSLPDGNLIQPHSFHPEQRRASCEDHSANICSKKCHQSNNETPHHIHFDFNDLPTTAFNRIRSLPECGMELPNSFYLEHRRTSGTFDSAISLSNNHDLCESAASSIGINDANSLFNSSDFTRRNERHHRPVGASNFIPDGNFNGIEECISLRCHNCHSEWR